MTTLTKTITKTTKTIYTIGKEVADNQSAWLIDALFNMPLVPGNKLAMVVGSGRYTASAKMVETVNSGVCIMMTIKRDGKVVARQVFV